MRKIVLYNTEGRDALVEQAYLKKLGLEDKYRVVRMDGRRDDEFFEEAKDAAGVAIVYLQANNEAFEKLPNCKVLATQCIGVNNIDAKAASDHNVYVGNVPDYCVEEVAVHTIGMLLGCVRNIGVQDRAVRDKIWDPHYGGEIHRMSNKVYGLLAFGNIPKKISEMMKVFGVTVVAYDPYSDDASFEACGVKRIHTMEELFEVCDYVSVHIPLIEATRNLVDEAVLAHAKKGMILIGTGRGGVIDEEALKKKLEDGTISSAGIDVIADEPNVYSPLMGMEQVLMTPHSAYYSEEAIVECREKAMMQIIEVLEYGKVPTYLVNKDMMK